MQLLELKCKNCNANLIILQDNIFICPYCNTQYILIQENGQIKEIKAISKEEEIPISI